MVYWSNYWPIIVGELYKIIIKQIKSIYKIDILDLYKLNFENISKKKKANIRKRTYNQNYLTLGFETGFTKKLVIAQRVVKNISNKHTPEVLLKGSENIS